jgi:hypothetical protein
VKKTFVPNIVLGFIFSAHIGAAGANAHASAPAGARLQKDVSSEEIYKPLQVEFSVTVDALAKIRAMGKYPPLDHFTGNVPRAEPPEAMVDENSETVKTVRRVFAETQAFLFGDQKPFKLVFCERCDMKPKLTGALTLYADIRFMEKLFTQMDPSIIDLDIAHAFSHYLIELYSISNQLKTPGGQISTHIDPNWLLPADQRKPESVSDRIMREARYHAEVEVLASAILLLMGKQIPDFSVVVNDYRALRLKNNPVHPFPPEHIYVDQEVRVNTINWIRRNWPSPLILSAPSTRI